MGETIKTTRLANIELMHIASMFLIVMTHYLGRGIVLCGGKRVGMAS